MILHLNQPTDHINVKLLFNVVVLVRAEHENDLCIELYVTRVSCNIGSLGVDFIDNQIELSKFWYTCKRTKENHSLVSFWVRILFIAIEMVCAPHLNLRPPTMFKLHYFI